MAKKKRKRNRQHSGESPGKYATALRQGKDILSRYWGGERQLTGGKYRRAYMHYSRESIQQAMFEYARGRKISALRTFRPLFSALKQPGDILPLAFYFAGRGKLWPSFHGTISRNINGKSLVDLVLEVDFKPDWKVAFQSARPLVNFLRDFGVDFKVKFSGHSSPHIIIPAEAFPPGVGHSVHLQILDYANKHVHGRAHLDMSFRSTSHFLRLAYSINENAGRVSVPIHPDGYERFNPKQHADIENVKILKDWWSVPEDAPERTGEMIKFILERKSISLPREMRAKVFRKAPAKQFQQLPAQVIIAGGRAARAEALRRLHMPYEQMLKTGQEMFQRRDELMGKPNVREAVEMLKTIHRKAGVVSTQEAAAKCEVDPEDLWFLWRWTLREDIFDYYARDDVQEAMFLHSIDRKVRLGNEDVAVELADPGDILPLAAYIHETQGGVDYPTFYCTNTKRDATTGDIIDCDVAVRIDGRGDGIAADRMARSAISLLRQAGADFAVLIGAEGEGVRERGDEGARERESVWLSARPPAPSLSRPLAPSSPRSFMTTRYIVIPSEAVPGMPRVEDEFVRVIEAMERHFKKALPLSEGISVLPIGEYIPLFYSVNETSGVANVPVRIDKKDVEQMVDSLSDVQVMQDWWDIPGEASAEMAELFRKVGLLVY
jgi:hypothetical protein